MQIMIKYLLQCGATGSTDSQPPVVQVRLAENSWQVNIWTIGDNIYQYKLCLEYEKNGLTKHWTLIKH